MDEKVKKALECCSRVYCCACPKVLDGDCMETLAAEVENYISDLEERLAITQESMDALEKRCNALEALEQSCDVLEVLEKRNEPQAPNYSVISAFNTQTGYKCPKCDTEIKYLQNYCSYCGQAVKWE